MILQVHDELVFDCYKSEEQQVRAIVEDAMLNALPLSIPVEISIDAGTNWLEAH
jgi:DNA polymerase-1